MEQVMRTHEDFSPDESDRHISSALKTKKNSVSAQKKLEFGEEVVQKDEP